IRNCNLNDIWPAHEGIPDFLDTLFLAVHPDNACSQIAELSCHISRRNKCKNFRRVILAAAVHSVFEPRKRMFGYKLFAALQIKIEVVDKAFKNRVAGDKNDISTALPEIMNGTF